MTLNLKYGIYIALLHLVILVLTVQLLQTHKVWIFAVEAGLIVSLIVAYYLYRSFAKPLTLIRQGVDAIRSQDFQNTLAPVHSPEITALVQVYNEMMAHIREERKEIQAQHYFLEKLIDASPSGILILDYDGFLTYMNPAATTLLGLSENRIGHSLENIHHPLIQQISDMQGGQSRVISLNGISQYKCQMAHFIHRGFARKFLLLEELTRELLDSEKKAYGKVIRMMAHEVNNSVGPINSILHSVLDMQADNLSLGAEKIGEVLQIAIERNENLNRFMQNFARVVRLPAIQPEIRSMDELLQHVVTLLEPQASEIGIQIHLNLAPEPLTASIDRALMEQAILNILKNALESIGSNGEIYITTGLNPRRLTIADNGPGLTEEQARQLFTPFYSSKPRGQGIGLTLVREILTRHGIRFSLKTGEDGWTRFEMEWGRAV
ncbi:MAG: ATP-binding protein [Bacteroidia bacterium]|nr:ATP-binding protein [Bacteroidia bacterium]